MTTLHRHLRFKNPDDPRLQKLAMRLAQRGDWWLANRLEAAHAQYNIVPYFDEQDTRYVSWPEEFLVVMPEWSERLGSLGWVLCPYSNTGLRYMWGNDCDYWAADFYTDFHGLILPEWRDEFANLPHAEVAA